MAHKLHLTLPAKTCNLRSTLVQQRLLGLPPTRNFGLPVAGDVCRFGPRLVELERRDFCTVSEINRDRKLLRSSTRQRYSSITLFTLLKLNEQTRLRFGVYSPYHNHADRRAVHWYAAFGTSSVAKPQHERLNALEGLTPAVYYAESDSYQILGALSVSVIAFLIYLYNQGDSSCKQRLSGSVNYKPGDPLDNLPTYTLADVKQHNNIGAGIWVTYKNGVYDITNFVQSHPGGDKILLASGGSLEPFFDLYGIHKTKEVMEMVESMRIGNIMEKEDRPVVSDAYEHDPPRHPVLKVNSEKPFNAEPPAQLIISNYITPSALFFVRNHLPVPRVTEVMAKDYKVVICDSNGNKSQTLTIEDLKKFPNHVITATLQCAGNRRTELAVVRHVKGLTWDAGSISTATWTGVKLCDVLRELGYKEEELENKHVHFDGLDSDPTGATYGASIPGDKAMDPRQDVLIAWQMNGEPLTPDHGYPLRVVVPGVAGARNVKWLRKITISDEESNSHWQRNDYKVFNPSIDFNTCNYANSAAIQELPVQSAICEPLPDTVISNGDEQITVKGYAYSGGGHAIIRVDVSADGGKTWRNAELRNNGQRRSRAWAWTLWEATLPIPAGHSGPLQLVCKAVDNAHNVQPDTADGIWNIRGFLNNAWHRITVYIE